MLNVIVYTMAFAAGGSMVATGLEHLAVRRGLPRRYVWMLAMLCSTVLPLMAMLNSGIADPHAAAVMNELPVTIEAAQAAPTTVLPMQAAHAHGTAHRAVAPGTPSGAWQLYAPSISSLLMAWAAVSATLLCLLMAAGILLRWRASRWQRTCILEQEVLASDDTGPALLGVLQPRIVVPRWFLDEPESMQALILEHERQHMAAHDPLVLRVATLLAIAAPWSLPLWWQLRRLRIAIELDCDARVMRGGAEASVYGEVLLEVTQRAAAMPVGAVAMSEPVSALELRIRNLAPAPDRHATARAIGALLFALAGVGVAAALDAPAIQSNSNAPSSNPSLPSVAAAPSRPAQPAQPASPARSAQPALPAQPSEPAGVAPPSSAQLPPASAAARQGGSTAMASAVAAMEPRANGMDVRDLIALAADKYHKKFVIDPRVRAWVEMIGFTPDSMTYHAFLEILGVHGFVAVPSDDVVTIIPESMARSVASPIVSPDRIEGEDSEFVTVIIPIPANINLLGLGATLRQLLGAGGVLNPLPDDRSLLLVDKVANVKRIVALVKAQTKAP